MTNTASDIRMETQMRTGNHYLMEALAVAYGAEPRVIVYKTGQFEPRSYEWLADGLYESNDNRKQLIEKSATGRKLYMHHFYHKLAEDALPNDREVKTMYLIGWPLDTYYSDGLVYSTEDYSTKPSEKHESFGKYIFKHNSPEWKKLEEEYMHDNAKWLNSLIGRKDIFVLRYEDIIQETEQTIERLVEQYGPFINEFPMPKKKYHRTYFTDTYSNKMDEAAFDRMVEIFGESLQHFWPEKMPLTFK